MNYNIDSLSLADAKFLFLETNRGVNCKDLKKQIDKDRQVLNPIIVTAAKNVKETPLYDPLSGEKVDNTGIHSEDLVVLDGQHRVMSCIELNIQHREDLKKYIQEKAAWQKQKEVEGDDSNEPQEPKDCSISHIPCLIANCFKNDKELNQYIITLNSTSKKWVNSDYVHNLQETHKEDEVANTINAFTELGFPLSTISRFMTFRKDAITQSNLAAYINGEIDSFGSSCDHKQGIKIYLALRKIGFKNMILKSRYLIDWLISMYSKNGMSMLSSLGQNSVDSISRLKADDFVVELEKKSKQSYKEAQAHEEVINMMDSFSNEDVDSFLNGGYKDYIEVKAKKAKTVVAKKPSDDTKEAIEIAKKVEKILPPKEEITSDLATQLTINSPGVVSVVDATEESVA